MRSKLVVLAAVVACGGTTQPSPMPSATTAQPTGVPDPIEAQIPGDALAVIYKASGARLLFRCPAVDSKLGPSFLARSSGERQLALYAGDFERSEITKCLVDRVTSLDPDAKVTDDGDTTTITSNAVVLDLKWHSHFITLAAIDSNKPKPAAPTRPSAEQIAAFHAMRSAQVALWSRLPFMKALTGIDAPELTVLLDVWDMPAEWHRKVSGTITARFASAADARVAAAQIAAGHITTVTDPDLIAAAKGLKVEISDATLRARVTNFTFDPRQLEQQFAPVVKQAE